MNSKLIIVAVAALAFTGCPNGAGPIPTPKAANITSFSVTPATVAAGDMVTVAWTVTNAHHLGLELIGDGPQAIDATALTGSKQLVITRDSTFVLTAQGEGGTDSSVKTVTLTGGGAGNFFLDASPRTVTPAGTTTLVWNAPGATAVTIKDTAGTSVDLGGQTSSGSVVVHPAASTKYTLEASGKTASVDVTVAPVILSFTSSAAPAPGAPVTLSWKTAAGSKVTLTREGVAAPLKVETDAALVANGSFIDTPPNLPVNGILAYRLELEQGTTKVTAQLTVTVGGAVKLNSFSVPGFVTTGASFTATWSTSAATSVEIFADDVPVYTAPDQATVTSGSATLPAFNGTSQRVRIVVKNNRGGSVTDEKVVATVGLPTFVSFTADRNTIANGGDPVVLSWNVTNGRDIRITQTGVGLVYATSSATADMGSVTVYPNRATSVFTLDASNGAGNSVMAATVTVTVTTVATLTFESLLPAGALGKVTGSTIVGGGDIIGLPTVAKDVPGEAYVDIASTGFLVTSGFDTAAATTTLSETFNMTLFGRRISSNSISTSPNGWFFFSTTAVSGPNTNTPIGTVLEPLAIAPYYKNLQFTVGQAYGRFDTVNGERRLIVQWENMEDLGFSGSSLSFQAQLYSSGKVVFAYGKFTGAPTHDGAIGIVNGNESQVIGAPDAPVAGTTYTFFGRATPPVTVGIDTVPYVARVAVGTNFVEVEGSGVLQPNLFTISEANPRPAAAVTNGEWFEVTNTTSTPLNLNGWTISFGPSSTHPITTSVPLPANSRIILAQANDLGEPTAGITAAYVYPATFTMPDANGTIALQIASANYATLSWEAPAAGVAVRRGVGDVVTPVPADRVYASGLTPASALSCPSVGTWGANGQIGTPGVAVSTPCFTYSVAPTTSAFTSIIGTGTKISTAGADANVYPLTLPTPINLYGSSISQIFIGDNGWISTNSTTTGADTNKTLPSTSAPVGTLAPFWDDLEENTGLTNTGIYWRQLDPDATPGTGDEVTIISWEHWRVYNFSATTMDLNFQIKILANGVVEYHYGPMVAAASGTDHQGTGATTWLEDRSGKIAVKVNINSATAPGIAANSAFRFTP